MRAPSHGFTLVELLVAVFVLSILAALSWRGLDGMVRAQSQLQARADKALALQVGLAQWTADLDAIEPLSQVTPIDWNGRVLRLVRRSAARGPEGADGVVVAAWAQHRVDGRETWLRWQSPPTVRRAELEQAWLEAEAWARDPVGAGRTGQVPVMPIEGWAILYFRDNAWREALDPAPAGPGPAAAPRPTAPGSPDAPAPELPAPPPEGVRLVLTLPQDAPVAGSLTLDWVSVRAHGRSTLRPAS